jgi:cell division protein FtsZ
MMGTGVADGEGRAMQAAQRAVSSPLLEDSSVTGARGVIINVTGGPDMSLMEVNEASCVIQESAHEDANIIFGAVIDPSLSGKIKITVIATGFDRAGSARHVPAAAVPTPTDLTSYTQHLARAEAIQPAEAAVHQAAPHTIASTGPSTGAPPAFTVTRRPALELSLPLTAGAGGHRRGDDIGLDLSSPLDVPAFLRRPN